MHEAALDALTAIELRELELLSWGAVDAAWAEDEIRALLANFGDPSILLPDLIDAALVVECPAGGYRSRSAETVRLLATLRQAFPGTRVTDGRNLVLDHRLLHRPRRRPVRNIDASQVLADLRGHLGSAGMAAASRIAPRVFSGFQQRSALAVLGALDGKRSGGTMITAGTGSGKSLAFYLPLISWLTDQTASHGQSGPRGTLALALYPRSELLKDQLRTLVGYAKRLDDIGTLQRPPLTIATWFGPTPTSALHVQRGWTDGWHRRGNGYICPYLRCLECDGELVWPASDCHAGNERLVCGSRSCGAVIEGRFLRLTRDRARREPADIMLSTTESLNRQLAAPGNLGAFGISPPTLAAVLLDEVHTYEGTTGAQNAHLLRRLKHRLGRPPVWVGLSATLRNAGEFFSRLVNVPESNVAVIEPAAAELEATGAEYLLALRHDPHSGTGTLSTTIQACMVLARCLDASTDDPFNPPPSSDGIFGSRLFAFTDKLDSTNRLYWDLLNAEGWNWPGKPLTRRPQTLAHLRGKSQDRLAASRQQPTEVRDPDGQWWWLPDQLGHGVDADRPLKIGRTSSQDRGVASDAQVVVATATLEVGFDDDRVGGVLQHKAPHDAAQFLQRKGRAGRSMRMRPWTVVVLSDWGRDRQAWEAYDALFDPELPARSLPVENLYVLRIQAVYALLDWLSMELRYSGQDSVWEDTAGPAAALFPNNPKRQIDTHRRQAALADHLGRVLHIGPERERLRRHLREALALGRGEWAESVVDTLLWDAPRPLLLAVVPTLRRQLNDQWRGEEPMSDEAGPRTRTPLRQFVPGNLFDDLLVPDVELRVPARAEATEVQHLPALRFLNEFCPGNVSRHFGVWAVSKRHWLALPDTNAGDTLVDIARSHQPVFVDRIYEGNEPVAVYAPTAAALSSVPEPVRDASSVRPDWRFHVMSLGAGASVRLARSAAQLLETVTAHLHVQGGGARVVRYAKTAQGTLFNPAREPVLMRFGISQEQGWSPAALGVDIQCDALEVKVKVPTTLGLPTPSERSQRLRHRLEFEAELPPEMSAFDRTSLVDVVQLAAVTELVEANTLLSDAMLTQKLRHAAESLGLVASIKADESNWRLWLDDSEVHSAILDALTEVSTDLRSAAWVTWWRRRFTLSAAQLTLAALSCLCPGVDTEDLLVDPSPDDDAAFWVSEPSPGGTGHIEAFQRRLAEDADAFPHALEDALTPSGAETMDHELSTLVRTDIAEVHAALEELRTSWRKGYASVELATAQVDQVVLAQNLALGRPARSALSTRLAGPGAHPQLLKKVASWLDLRDHVAELGRLEVSARMLGVLLADDDELDDILRLGTDVTPLRRSRAVSNVLWPWGHASEPALAFNPYGRGVAPSFSTLRSRVSFGPAILQVDVWGDDERSMLHKLLVEQGEVALRAGHAKRSIIRSILLDLQTNPVEVGSLLCHPVAVGLRLLVSDVEVRVALRETL